MVGCLPCFGLVSLCSYNDRFFVVVVFYSFVVIFFNFIFIDGWLADCLVSVVGMQAAQVLHLLQPDPVCRRQRHLHPAQDPGKLVSLCLTPWMYYARLDISINFIQECLPCLCY